MDGAFGDVKGGAGDGPVRSTCPYCGVGCGVLLQPDGRGGLTVSGDPDHPANQGRLCSKGTALAETVAQHHRLLSPRIGNRDVSWDDALDHVARGFRRTIDEHGPDSVAFYVSGQLLTEDYYVANKLMKGFIGSANIDTNSRLCMASSVAGHKRAFGTDTVPGTYEDIDTADLVVLTGSNLAWCHPVLYQRLLEARAARGTRIVVIDPRRTASCDMADLHLAIRPGADVALFNRLLLALHDNGAVDQKFLRHTEGFDAALAAARSDTSTDIGVSEDQIAAFCALWASTERVVTIYSQGVNQSSAGTDKVNAILNCHLATGRIGKPGCGPFSVTGQPNAMGGREVGGLANMLACHLDLENAAHRAAVQAHWQSPAMPAAPGLKAVDLFNAVETGQIKALWIMHTNPAVTLPEAKRVRRALGACPLVVVSDITDRTDTAQLADVLLPAAAWAEKEGTVTNSDRTISRQRRVLDPVGAAKPDWWHLAQVAQRMGWPEAFSYDGPAEIFREYAALSGLAASFGKDFDISALAGLNDAAYHALTPTRWPVSSRRQGGRFFGDGRFFHADGKARLVPVAYRAPVGVVSRDHPFVLNTGRNRDQWHTMTRTGLSARLAAHLPEPHVDLNPADARHLDVQPADLLELESPSGRAILRVRLTEDVAPGQVFAPIHWTGQTAPSGRVDDLVAAVVDPLSGQPESKACPVVLRRFRPAWYGFAISAHEITPSTDYWACVRTATGVRAELADTVPTKDWVAYARALFDLPDAQVSSVIDSRGQARLVFTQDGRCVAALFTAPTPIAASRDYLVGALGNAVPSLLTGRAPVDQPDPGPIVCACFNVGLNTIRQAIETQGLVCEEEIGAALQAGTNCGSCRPELGDILRSMVFHEAAE